MNGSMSRMGPGWDHAPTESVFNPVKHERVNGLREQYAQR